MENLHKKKNPSPDAPSWEGSAVGSGSSQRSSSVATGNMQTIRKPEHDLTCRWELTEKDVDEWERICRHIRWNVFMSYEKVSCWVWKLPSLLAMTNARTPNFFPRGRFSDYGKFLDSVKRMLLYCRTLTEDNIYEPLHGYRRRKEIVSVIDKVEEKAISQNEMNKWFSEWDTFYKRFYSSESISDEEEKKWFRRCAAIEFQKEEAFEEFEEGVLLTDFYICVSSGLRELRCYKEKVQEKEECMQHQLDDKGSSSTIDDRRR